MRYQLRYIPPQYLFASAKVIEKNENGAFFDIKICIIQKKYIPLHPQMQLSIIYITPKLNAFSTVDALQSFIGAIAQLVEQRTENPCVPGSIPGGTTKIESHFG